MDNDLSSVPDTQRDSVSSHLLLVALLMEVSRFDKMCVCVCVCVATLYHVCVHCVLYKLYSLILGDASILCQSSVCVCVCVTTLYCVCARVHCVLYKHNLYNFRRCRYLVPKFCAREAC